MITEQEAERLLLQGEPSLSSIGIVFDVPKGAYKIDPSQATRIRADLRLVAYHLSHDIIQRSNLVDIGNDTLAIIDVDMVHATIPGTLGTTKQIPLLPLMRMVSFDYSWHGMSVDDIGIVIDIAGGSTSIRINGASASFKLRKPPEPAYEDKRPVEAWTFAVGHIRTHGGAAIMYEPKVRNIPFAAERIRINKDSSIAFVFRNNVVHYLEQGQ